jgi:hypothetical protein
MKFSTVFFSAIFAATALAAPGPVPDLAPAPAPEGITPSLP